MKYNFEAIYDAPTVSTKAIGKTTSTLLQLARNIFGEAILYNTKKKAQDITPLNKIDLSLLPKN